MHCVFADTSFWIALVFTRDQFHSLAREYSQLIESEIVTTSAVLLETTNALALPPWRRAVVTLVNRIQDRDDIEVVPLSSDLWERGWKLFVDRPDKGWSLTDCISFVVMHDRGIADALTSDMHFQQAGFRPLLSDDAS